MDVILGILATVLVLAGMAVMMRGDPVRGMIFILVGVLIGPGGVSIFG